MKENEIKILPTKESVNVLSAVAGHEGKLPLQPSDFDNPLGDFLPLPLVRVSNMRRPEARDMIDDRVSEYNHK